METIVKVIVVATIAGAIYTVGAAKWHDYEHRVRVAAEQVERALECEKLRGKINELDSDLECGSPAPETKEYVL